jgi:hypothetical protein
MKTAAVVPALPAIALAVICLIPYLNKAYLIDDPLFLLTARQILHDPLRPLAFEVCWVGNETCAWAYEMASGTVLGAYFLAPVSSCFSLRDAPGMRI